MLQSILEHLNQIIAIAATGFGGYVGRQVIKLISSHLKGFYAKVAVEFVEQTANDLAGSEKFKVAVDKFAGFLRSKHIKVTDAEAEMFIESAVKKMNIGLQKELTKVESK